MRSEAQINTLAFGQEAGYISASKAISDGPDSLDTKVIAHVCNRLLDDGIDVGGLVVGKPRGQVELAFGNVARNCVAGEQIWYHGKVSCASI
jgi:hypothetical protein